MKPKDYLIFFLVAVGILLSIWAKVSVPKMAYVKTADLVNGYLGMKEASIEYQKKSNEWQGNLDSLKRILQREAISYAQDSLSFSANEKKKRMHTISRLQSDYMEYSRNIADKASKEDEEMTQRVLNQVNSFIEQYGKEKGYTIILGTTSSGNIMYANDAIDITKEVLDALNTNYKK